MKRQQEVTVAMGIGAGRDGVGGTDNVMSMKRLIEEHVGNEGMYDLDDEN